MTGMDAVALGFRGSAAEGVAEFRALACPTCGSGLRSYSARTNDFLCEQGHASVQVATPATGAPVVVGGGSVRRRPARCLDRLVVGEASVLGPICGTSHEQLRARLAALKQAGARALLVTLDSCGGDVDAAWQMHDTVRSADMPVVVYVAHRAESAATIVTLAAAHVVLAPGGWLMVHRPLTGDGSAVADAEAQLAALYVAQTAEDEESVLGYLEGGADVVLNSVVALGRGWVDSVGDSAHALRVAQALAGGEHVTSPRALACALSARRRA